MPERFKPESNEIRETKEQDEEKDKMKGVSRRRREEKKNMEQSERSSSTRPPPGEAEKVMVSVAAGVTKGGREMYISKYQRYHCLLPDDDDD